MSCELASLSLWWVKNLTVCVSVPVNVSSLAVLLKLCFHRVAHLRTGWWRKMKICGGEMAASGNISSLIVHLLSEGGCS